MVAGSVWPVQILVATDADWIVDDVVAALGGDGVSFIVCREGRVVSDQVAERRPDLVITDLQIGSMGGMAVTMSLRLDESAGALPHVPVLMLVDRRADLHLARRSGAEGWLIKPVDALRLKRAATALIAGGTYTEGVPAVLDGAQAEAADEASDDLADGAGEAPSPEEEPASAG